jgi:hypothetical protein
MIALIVLAGAAHRFALSRVHFTHIDDIAVAVTIATAKESPPNVEDLLAIAHAKGGSSYRSPRIQLLLDLERLGILRPLHAITGAAYPYIAVPLTFTYAPLQFILTGFLVHPGQDYASTKFWGRLPSVILSVLSIVLLGAVGLSLGKGATIGTALLLVSMLAFSGQHTTNAALMHSYAAASFAAAALLLLTARDALRHDNSALFIFGRSLLLVALCYLSYQACVLLPGYFAAITIGAWKRASPNGALRVVARCLVFAAIVGIAFLPAYLLRVKDLVIVHYNAGPDGEFVIPTDSGILALRLIGRNSWITLKSLVSPVSDYSFSATLIGGLVLVGMAAGLARMLMLANRKQNWTAAAALGVSCSITLALYVLLALAGKLVLAPTRHALAYLPYIAVPAVYGLCTITIWVSSRYSIWRPRKLWLALALCGSLFLGFAFYNQVGTLFNDRSDRFDENEVRALAEAYNVDLVVARDSVQLFVMPAVSNFAPIRGLAEPASRYSVGSTPNEPPRRILLAAQYQPFSEDACKLLQDWLVSNFRLRPWMPPCLLGVRALYAKTVQSGVEVEFSQRTRNGTNGIYIDVIELGAKLPQ